MQEATHAEQSADVTHRDRGARIQRRLDDLRMSDRQFHDFSGVDRKTLRRAVAGDTSVRANTYRTIEDWLDRAETRAKGAEGLPEDPDEESRLVSYRIKGDFGVEVVVEGPVKDRAELEASAMRLMRELRAERGEGEGDRPAQ